MPDPKTGALPLGDGPKATLHFTAAARARQGLARDLAPKAAAPSVSARTLAKLRFMWPFSNKEGAGAPNDERFGAAKIERAQLLWKQGTRFLERRRPEKAIESFEEAYAIEPSRLEGRLNMGAALYLADRPQEALPHLKYVLAIEPHNTIALLNLAATYDALGRIDDSILTLEKLVEGRPNWADANYNLAVAYMKQDRAEEATAALRRELTINPKHDAARTLLNELHLRLPHSKSKGQGTGDKS